MKPGAEPRGWHFAIDRGGTFTDVVGVSPSGGAAHLKVLSRDPLHPGDPAVRGMESVLAAHDAARERRVLAVRLGTTVATNALLERKGDPTLLVTTRGLRDALRIGYQKRPDIFARAIHLPPPLYAQSSRPTSGSTPRRGAHRRSTRPTARGLARARDARHRLGRDRVHARLPAPAARTACRGIAREAGFQRSLDLA